MKWSMLICGDYLIHLRESRIDLIFSNSNIDSTRITRLLMKTVSGKQRKLTYWTVFSEQFFTEQCPLSRIENRLSIIRSQICENVSWSIYFNLCKQRDGLWTVKGHQSRRSTENLNLQARLQDSNDNIESKITFSNLSKCVSKKLFKRAEGLSKNTWSSDPQIFK